MSIEDIQTTAAEWLAREDRGLSDDERRGLEGWLAASTLHEVCYLRLQASWERADRLASLREPLLRDFAPVHKARPGWAPLLAVAATAIIAVVGGYHYRARVVQNAYSTSVGELRSLRLADGTTVQLNSNTILRSKISGNVRSVMLDRGEAFFDVVHDPDRPFVVYAGKKRVRDIGTKFSVYRIGDDVRVVVKEGSVVIEDANPARSHSEALVGVAQVAATRGTEVLISNKSSKEVSSALSWRDGTLIFEQQTLAEAAQAFNRYNTKQLLIDGDARDMKIGGRFKANNVESFVLLLHKGFGLAVKDQGSAIIVSR